MHLKDRCRFLNCSVRTGGGGGEGFVMNSQATSLEGRIKGVEGWEGGESKGENKRGGGVGVRYIMNSKRTLLQVLT
jgi:hypothetical protein